MTDEREEVIGLTREILNRYFTENDLYFLLSYLDDDVVWIGGGRKQKAEGREAVSRWFLDHWDDSFPVILENQRYEYCKLCKGHYICEGFSEFNSRQEDGFVLSSYQRCTIVYRRKANGSLKIAHIHHSIAYDALEEDELFPETYGKEQYRILQDAFEKQSREIQDVSRALNRQAIQLQQLYQSVPCGIIQLRRREPFDILSANLQAGSIFEAAGGGEGTTSYLRSLREKIIAVPGLADSLVGDGPRQFEICFPTAGGRERWVSVHLQSLRNEYDEETIQAIIIDVTSERQIQIEKENRQLLENRLLSGALMVSNNVISTVNLTKGRCTLTADDGYIRRLPSDITYEELFDHVIETLHPDDRAEFREKFTQSNIIKAVSGGCDEIGMELRQLGEDDKYHWISFTFIHVDNPVGEDLMGIGVIKVLDVQKSEKLRQDSLLRDALESAKAASEAKSDFLSRVSHDIRTPLNAIIGMSLLGQMRIDDLAEVKNCFEKIDQSSKYLLSLINDILCMSKIESGKIRLDIESFKLEELFGGLWQIIETQVADKNITYRCTGLENVCDSYDGDVTKIHQILLNLLTNAVKFTPQGGEVTLSVKEGGRDGIYTKLLFSVTDTGCGISEEFMERLFLPFEQEKSGGARNLEGTGLGLAIVYSLVKLMDGTVSVRSKKGEMSSFEVMLPVLAADREPLRCGAEEQLSGAAADIDNLRGMRILLVEDNEINMEIAKSFLTFKGAFVDTADNGAVAVNKYAEAPGGYYGCILMDIRMPVMDGLEASRRIRALEIGGRKRTPIIALSANAFEEDIRLAQEAGIDEYIVKPIDFRKVTAALSVCRSSAR